MKVVSGLALAVAIAWQAQACDDGYAIQRVAGDGSVIVLDDGSVWLVDPIDRINSSLWLPADEIIVCDDRLVNVDDQEEVMVRRLR